MQKKLIILALIGVGIGLYFGLDMGRWLTLDSMNQWIGDARAWRDAHPVLVSAGFFALYVGVTALSLPGATIMTLAGGALFGLVWGLLLISFASTIGATLAFLAARYVVGEAVQRRFGDRLKTINAGVRRDGGFYLFSLRLVPLFPFFLINLVMGLTPIKTWTYYWVSQLGMLPGTVVYINAGTQLALIDSLSGILSPILILSFIAIGLFPLAARLLVKGLQRYRATRQPEKHPD